MCPRIAAAGSAEEVVLCEIATEVQVEDMLHQRGEGNVVKRVCRKKEEKQLLVVVGGRGERERESAVLRLSGVGSRYEG